MIIGLLALGDPKKRIASSRQSRIYRALLNHYWVPSRYRCACGEKVIDRRTWVKHLTIDVVEPLIDTSQAGR